MTKAVSETLPQFIQKGSEMVTSLAKGISMALPGIAKSIADVLPLLLSSLPEIIAALPRIISGIVGFLTGDALPQLIQAGIQLLTSLVSAIPEITNSIGANLALGLGEGFEAAMKDVTRDMENAVPTDFDIDANVKGAMNGVSGQGGGGFSLVLHIGTFVNNTAQDLRQLADELSTIMAGEIRRKGLLTT